MLMYFVELAVVNEAANNVLHIVRCIRIVGNERVEALILTIRIIARLNMRGLLHVVAREEREQIADLINAVLIVLRSEMCNTGTGVVRHRAAEFLCRNLFRRNGLNNSRAGDEHLARVLHHVDVSL